VRDSEMGKLAVLLILKLEGSDLASLIQTTHITIAMVSRTLELVPIQLLFDRIMAFSRR
jgi:hypothetical protein